MWDFYCEESILAAMRGETDPDDETPIMCVASYWGNYREQCREDEEKRSEHLKECVEERHFCGVFQNPFDARDPESFKTSYMDSVREQNHLESLTDAEKLFKFEL